jgi:hypothetical protein
VGPDTLQNEASKILTYQREELGGMNPFEYMQKVAPGQFFLIKNPRISGVRRESSAILTRWKKTYPPLMWNPNGTTLDQPVPQSKAEEYELRMMTEPEIQALGWE